MTIFGIKGPKGRQQPVWYYYSDPTTLNGEVKGTIANAAFVEALLTVWFGEKPASKDMRKKLSGQED